MKYINRISKNRRKLSLVAGIFLTVFGIILNYTYRQYIYQNHYYDFHIADTIGSILCVPASSLFFYGINDKYTFKFLLIGSFVVFILYEFATLSPYHGTFDYYDLIAICISTGLTYCAYRIIKNKLHKML